MTGNRKLFLSYKAYNEGNVIFGSNLHGNIIGKGQIYDNKCRVTFSKHDSEITKDGKVIGRGIRKKGLYVMKLGNKPKDKICLATIDENSMLWHRRLGHANMRLIQSLASKELVRNLPKLKFDQHFCDACKIGKQAHASHKAKNIVSMTRCLELLHMDLFGPSAVRSYGGNRYTLVIVDDYSSFVMPMELHITSQLHALLKSNGVVKRKNRTLHEMSRTMLNDQSLPQKFWCNTVDTSTYILNRILIRAILGKTPYELLRGRKPTLDYFRVFGSKCFILNTKDYLTKFDPKSYEDEEEAIKVTEKKNLENDIVGCCLTSWFLKKQTALAISTTEAEYISAEKACQQALWMKQALIDYDVRLDDVPIMCDNKGAIDLSKNLVQHSRTKYIEIRHHFLRDNVQKGHISIEKVPSVENIADILTKPLKRESFNYLRLGLGMMEHIP
ncbi:retrovirus-related pol polyprotein from transposon TNT 1-94 [Tanacetum coccineum]